MFNVLDKEMCNYLMGILTWCIYNWINNKWMLVLASVKLHIHIVKVELWILYPKGIFLMRFVSGIKTCELTKFWLFFLKSQSCLQTKL